MKTNWYDWKDVCLALDEIVLVRFQFRDGSTHIEDAEILKDDETGEFSYVLFDGDSYNVKVTPIQWMRIPE